MIVGHTYTQTWLKSPRLTHHYVTNCKLTKPRADLELSSLPCWPLSHSGYGFDKRGWLSCVHQDRTSRIQWTHSLTVSANGMLANDVIRIERFQGSSGYDNRKRLECRLRSVASCSMKLTGHFSLIHTVIHTTENPGSCPERSTYRPFELDRTCRTRGT